MRIKSFCKFIEVNLLHKHILNNSTVIIDGQNFFYTQYHKSGLQFVFGCESDKYAEYLRKYLSMFKKANVKCYFIFKGGHENMSKKFQKRSECLEGKEFVVGEEYDNIVLPIFMKDIYKQVLDEMGFDYTICEFEAKKECIAFAQKHGWPIISFDIEFCFAGVEYIPSSTLVYNKEKEILNCGIFKFSDLLKKYYLTKEKLALFIVLTDSYIFPENHFKSFFKASKIPHLSFHRIIKLLSWLSRKNRDTAVNEIFRHITEEDKIKFLEEESQMRNMICRREKPGVATEYLENGNELQVLDEDPLWFEKGVASKFIAIQYVNLYRSSIMLGSWAIADKEADDALLFSMEIISYAFNLLTNFQNDTFTFISNNDEKISMTVTAFVQKPKYQAITSVFENGWNRLSSLGLFEHFLNEALQGFDFECLEKLPEDARLLMIALIYFSRKKQVDTRNEIYSILLSYVALSLLSDVQGSYADSNFYENFPSKPLLDPTTNRDDVVDSDRTIAKSILAEYFKKVDHLEAKEIIDEKLIHPLVEFQHCFQHLNFLNQLCGRPYKPTKYSETYNGTFVYKILHTIKKENCGREQDFIEQKLNPAATVLAYLNGIIELYEEIMFS